MKKASAFFAREGSRSGSRSSLGRRRASPSTAGATCLASVKAAISPGEVGRLPPPTCDRVLPAHVRAAFALSNGTYGSPRMTRQLQEAGLVVGRRQIARDARQRPVGSAAAAV